MKESRRNDTWKAYKWLVCVALLLWAGPLRALVYTNSELGFRAKLPDGFENFADQTRVKALVSLGRLDAAKGVEVVLLQDLGGTIRRGDALKHPDELSRGTLEKAVWKGLSIDQFKVVERLKSVPWVTLNAQVPLAPHAIQVTVTGPQKDEAKLRQEMQGILASIEGPSNWLGAPESPRSAAPAPGLLAGLVGLIILLTGKLRITRGYGLEGTGARVAGFLILLASLALPTLLVSALRMVYPHGPGLYALVLGLIVFPCLLVWGCIWLLVRHYGNAYALLEEPAPALAPNATAQPLPLAQLITHCPMCGVALASAEQATARTCPSCGADLRRRRV